MNLTLISLYAQALVYMAAGVNHFANPRMYRAIMPPYLRAVRDPLINLSGVAEILLGVGLCFPQTRVWAAWGLIALLIAVFPANLYMATGEKFQNVSPWLRWGRLPIQGLLIWWAYQFTKPQ